MALRGVLFASSALALALLAIPVAYLLVRAAGAGADAWADLLDHETIVLALRSVALAVAVAAGAVVVAVPYAFLTVRTDLPLRRVWALLGALPLVIPSYVGALTLIGAFGPRGLLQRLLEPLGVQRLPELYGFGGAWAALVLFTYPYVLLLVSAAWLRVDRSLERAARSSGMPPLQAFRVAVVPQLRPSVAAGALFCALYTLSDFGVVSLMRCNTFTREIFIHYRSLFDREGAALLSLVLVSLTIVVLVVERRVLRGAVGSSRRRVQARDDLQPVALGGWRVPALLFCGSVSGLALVVPLGVLGWWIFDQAADVGLAQQLQVAWGAVVGSVTAAGVAALACLLLALPIALLAVRYPSRLTGSIEAVTYAGFALPGVVAALALVFFATRYAFPLYQTLPLLVAAYVIRFLPQAVGASRSAFERVSPTLESAARGMGLGRVRSFTTVTLPLAAPGVLAGAMLVFLTAMKELPATLILRPTEFETLATVIWQQSSVGDYPEAALPALVLVGASALPLWWLVIRRGSREVAAE